MREDEPAPVDGDREVRRVGDEARPRVGPQVEPLDAVVGHARSIRHDARAPAEIEIPPARVDRGARVVDVVLLVHDERTHAGSVEVHREDVGSEAVRADAREREDHLAAVGGDRRTGREGVGRDIVLPDDPARRVEREEAGGVGEHEGDRRRGERDVRAARRADRWAGRALTARTEGQDRAYRDDAHATAHGVPPQPTATGGKADCAIVFLPQYSTRSPCGERRGALQPSIVRAGFVRAAASAIAALLVAASCTSPAPGQSAGESGGDGAPPITTRLTHREIALLDSKHTIVAALDHPNSAKLTRYQNEPDQHAAATAA